MENTYALEIAHVVREDGLAHAGAVFRPHGDTRKPVAVLMLHGIAGKFYYPVYLRLGQLMSEQGYLFITANNRGHDFGFDTFRAGGGERLILGSGWERFSESPLDIDAWISYGISQGAAGVVLVGHSYGGIKATYYAGLRQDLRVRGLVCASAPLVVARLSNPQLVGLARNMVAQGKGRELLPWGIIPFGPGTISAESYLDAVSANIDVFGQLAPGSSVERVTCPILAMYGTAEEQVGTALELDIIRRNARSAPSVDTALVEGMDHGYSGHEEAVAKLVMDWMGRVVLG